MLHEFLETNEKGILELSEAKSKKLAGSLSNSVQLKKGLPIFLKLLIGTLKDKEAAIRPSKEMLSTAASHGKELLSLGYSLSHVVHSYGAMCQAITELATLKNAKITSSEFNILNGCLDVAIASAVSEFQYQSNDAIDKREIAHLGFLAHELRNSLSSVTVAHEMIKAGLVGVGGSTAHVLETNLVHMRNLIDRSLSEVRMRADADPLIEKFFLAILLDQIVITAKIDSDKKNQTLAIEVDEPIEVEADRQYLLSAIANLVQNAIKYTKSGGKIILRAKALGDRVRVEISDQCAGLDPTKISSLFEPFVQEDSTKGGLGLGLAITKRAVHLSQGTISAHNNPDEGCSFVIDLPHKFVRGPSQKTAVQGKDSVQPNFLKKI